MLELPSGLSRELLHHHRVCPKRWLDNGVLSVLVCSESRLSVLDDLQVAYDATIQTEMASPDDVEREIERLTAALQPRDVELTRVRDDAAADVRDLVNQPPVVRYVNFLVGEAFRAGASDIHLEATRVGLSTAFRLDGVRIPAPEAPPGLQAAVVSRIKLLAELDIAERRRPQDGRIRVEMGSRDLDLRVSTVPTLQGESVVLRLLERGGRPVSLDELGIPAGLLSKVQEIAARPQGMFLVTGPTGSGKTTTLYAALALRNPLTERILTVEDPVEYHLDGVAQVPVLAQAGVTFASALRSILRQDPDVLMVGEMRDQETALIAIQAALTGHLVFSTLHTNDAIDAIPRLLDMGVEDYLINATLTGVLAQRLIRRVCSACVRSFTPGPELMQRAERHWGDLTEISFVSGQGCDRCRGTGYRGRIGVFELMLVTDDIRSAVTRRAPLAETRRIAETGGWVPMRNEALRLAASGVTTLQEVLRVVQ